MKSGETKDSDIASAAVNDLIRKLRRLRQGRKNVREDSLRKLQGQGSRDLYRHRQLLRRLLAADH